MKRYALLLGVLVLAVVMVSCASVGRNFDSTKVPMVEIGKTTKADIEAWFGMPYQTTLLSNMPSGGVLRYTYTSAKASYGGMKSSGKTLVVDFDKNNIVVDKGYSEQN